MAHMHRAGRIGRHIFDIDGYALALVGPAIFAAQPSDFQQFIDQHRRSDAQVDKSGTGDLHRLHVVQRAKLVGDFLGKITRLHASRFREDHRGIGRQVTVRRVARWLHRHIRSIHSDRQNACFGQFVQNRIDMFLENMEQHDWLNSS